MVRHHHHHRLRAPLEGWRGRRRSREDDAGDQPDLALHLLSSLRLVFVRIPGVYRDFDAFLAHPFSPRSATVVIVVSRTMATARRSWIGSTASASRAAGHPDAAAAGEARQGAQRGGPLRHLPTVLYLLGLPVPKDAREESSSRRSTPALRRSPSGAYCALLPGSRPVAGPASRQPRRIDVEQAGDRQAAKPGLHQLVGRIPGGRKPRRSRMSRPAKPDMPVVILCGGQGTRLARRPSSGPSPWSRSATGRSSGTS